MQSFQEWLPGLPLRLSDGNQLEEAHQAGMEGCGVEGAGVQGIQPWLLLLPAARLLPSRIPSLCLSPLPRSGLSQCDSLGLGRPLERG